MEGQAGWESLRTFCPEKPQRASCSHFTPSTKGTAAGSASWFRESWSPREKCYSLSSQEVLQPPIGHDGRLHLQQTAHLQLKAARKKMAVSRGHMDSYRWTASLWGGRVESSPAMRLMQISMVPCLTPRVRHSPTSWLWEDPIQCCWGPFTCTVLIELSYCS